MVKTRHGISSVLLPWPFIELLALCAQQLFVFCLYFEHITFFLQYIFGLFIALTV